MFRLLLALLLVASTARALDIRGPERLDVQLGLGEDAAREAIVKQMPELAACALRLPLPAPSWDDRVRIKFEVKRDGTVGQPGIEGGSVAGPCAQKVIAGWRFPAPPGPSSIHFDLHFVVSPAEAEAARQQVVAGLKAFCDLLGPPGEDGTISGAAAATAGTKVRATKTQWDPWMTAMLDVLPEFEGAPDVRRMLASMFADGRAVAPKVAACPVVETVAREAP